MSPAVRPVLRRGERVAIVSPASAARPELIHAGAEALRRYGYDPVLMPHALSRGPLYFAGTAEERAADLLSAFADPSLRGVFCTRGGWGSAELLPLLQADVVQRDPKLFAGYSDHSSIHTWLWQECGVVSLYAPMVAADWSHPEGVDHPSWVAAVEGRAHTFGQQDSLRALVPGQASGRLQGGCLAILEAGLATPWAMRLDEPCVLFAEDIGVKPYQWDRMLQHLRFAGLLENVTGIVLGDMSANVAEAELPLLEAACLHALRDFKGPVAIGLRCGHVTGGNRSLALGALATLQCTGQDAQLRVAGLAVPAEEKDGQWASTSI